MVATWKRHIQPLFHGVAASFEACRSRLGKPRLLLLRGGLRLLLTLLSSRRILFPAPASSDCGARRRAGSGISAHNLTHDRSARRAAKASAWSRAGCGCWWLSGRRWRRRLRRIESSLLDRPRYVASSPATRSDPRTALLKSTKPFAVVGGYASPSTCVLPQRGAQTERSART
jgi:hypothetical protein